VKTAPPSLSSLLLTPGSPSLLEKQSKMIKNSLKK